MSTEYGVCALDLVQLAGTTNLLHNHLEQETGEHATSTGWNCRHRSRERSHLPRGPGNNSLRSWQRQITSSHNENGAIAL